MAGPALELCVGDSLAAALAEWHALARDLGDQHSTNIACQHAGLLNWLR